MSAEIAAKALVLYERRAHGYYRRVKEAPDREKVLAAYGRLLILREDIIHDFAWIMAAVDAIHSELVNGLIDLTTDAAVITVLRNDPVLRYEAELAAYAAAEDDEEEEEETSCSCGKKGSCQSPIMEA